MISEPVQTQGPELLERVLFGIMSRRLPTVDSYLLFHSPRQNEFPQAARPHLQ